MKTIKFNSNTRKLNTVLNNGIKRGIPIAMRNGKILYRTAQNEFAIDIELIIPDNVYINDLMS